MPYDTLSLDQSGHVATVTMTRTERRNPFDRAAAEEIARALDEAVARPETRVVVLTGSGDFFSAGADVRVFRDASGAELARLLEPVVDLAKKFFRLRVPTIARVNGMALGGGAGLVSLCDFAIAVDDTVIGYPEIHLGIFPATVGVLLARSVPRRVAVDLLFTGRRISTVEAARLNVINEAVARDRLDARVAELAAELAAKSPRALATLKSAFYAQADRDYESALDLVIEQFVELASGPDAKEGLSAFLEKRRPRWTSEP